MMEQFEDKIIPYIKGALTPAEKSEFEQAMSIFPKLREEVEEERRLIRFEAYLDYDMTEQERIAFEAEMESDSTLADEFTQYQNASNVLHFESRMEFNAMATAYDETEAVPSTKEKPKVTPRIVPFRTIAIAASILLLLGAGLWFFVFPPKSPQQLAIKAFTIAKPPTSLGMTPPPYPAEYKKGLDYYEKKDHDAAVKALQSISKEDQIYTTAQFLLGNCLMVKKQFESATLAFKEANPKDDPSGKINWYLALAYLADGQLVEGKAILGTVAARAKNPIYKAKANQLITQLK